MLYPKFSRVLTQKQVNELLEELVGPPLRVPEGTIVYARKRKQTGRATGKTHRCRQEGCLGFRVSVRWKGGKMTYPCTKGMKHYSGRKGSYWEII